MYDIESLKEQIVAKFDCMSFLDFLDIDMDSLVEFFEDEIRERADEFFRATEG